MSCVLPTTPKSRCSSRFCNKHFFGESELFTHMQQAHEQCHICKKDHPDRFIYYKDYNDLEGTHPLLPPPLPTPPPNVFSYHHLTGAMVYKKVFREPT